MATTMKNPRHEMLLMLALFSLPTTAWAESEQGAAKSEPRIKAFCIDFNWGPGGPNGFAAPGVYNQADPAERRQSDPSVSETRIRCGGLARPRCVGYISHVSRALWQELVGLEPAQTRAGARVERIPAPSQGA